MGKQMSEEMERIDAIRKRNEVLLRMAITHLFDVGWKNITPGSVEATIEYIRKEERKDKAMGRIAVMTADFQVDLMQTCLELKQFSPVTLLVYVSNYLRFYE